MNKPAEAAHKKIAADYRAQAERLKDLASRVDAELTFTCYALAKIIAQKQAPVHEAAAPRIEAAAYELMPYFGVGTLQDPEERENLILLLDECYVTRCAQTTLVNSSGDTPVDRLVDDLRIYSEMVRGTAFPVHTIDRIQTLFAPFDKQLSEHLGIGPIKAAKVVTTLAWILSTNHEMAAQKLERIKERRDALFKNPNRSWEEETEFMGMNTRAQEWFDETSRLWPATPPQVFSHIPDLMPN